MEMKIDGRLVKLLRTQRSWSQEELGSAADLSLRTIQRIENTGSCSLESKRALAAVFEIGASDLEIDERAIAAGIENNRGRRLGFMGAGIGLLSAYAAITFSLYSGSLAMAEAGIYYGITAALCGSCVAIIGVMSRKHAERLTHNERAGNPEV